MSNSSNIAQMREEDLIAARALTEAARKIQAANSTAAREY